MVLRLILLLSFVYLASANSRVRRIVGGERAELPPSPSENIQYSPPEPEDREPYVFIKNNRRIAEVIGNKNPDGSANFLGIRYGDIPVKRRRFARPNLVKLKGTVDAKRFGHPCPQWYHRRIVGKENCLFLNVYTPRVSCCNGDGNSNSNSSSTYPVLIWIHGGNFKTGSASQYVPRKELIRKGLVIVTVQYRLGTLGFLSHKSKDLNANAGLFDISLAVRWVKNYIRFFGGDPEQITAAGQGSGASCASHVVLNSYAGRHIKRLIALSGTPVSPFAMDESDVRSADAIAKVDGCATKDDLDFARCFQDLPLETIMKGDSSVETTQKKESKVVKKLANLFTPGPAEEGKDDFRFLPNFIVESPLEAIKNGKFPKIPLLTGVTKQETGAGVKGNLFQEFSNLLLSQVFLTQEIFRDLLEANIGLYVNNTADPSLSKLFESSKYLEFFNTIVSSTLSGLEKIVQHTTDALFNLPAFIFSNMWSKRNNVYLYSFEHKPQKSEAYLFLNDITLVSNRSENDQGPSHGDDLAYLFDIRSLEGEPLTDRDSELSEADKEVSDHFTTVISEFAKSGTPRTKGGDDWKPFNAQEGNYMIIDENPKMEKGFRKCSMGLWTGNTDLLNSAECALSGASEIVQNTLGSTGTQLVKTVGSVVNTTGSVGAVTGKINKVTNIGGLLGSGSENKKSGGGLLGNRSPLLGNTFFNGK